MFNRESNIKDIMKNPFGKDIVMQIERELPALVRRVMGLSFLKRVKLGTLLKFTGKRRGQFEELIDIICEKMNESKKEKVRSEDEKFKSVWWQESVFYQVYPRSFRDGNCDGIGDLKGIIEKVDYLSDLGFGGIWLSPVYDTPNDDNGYDIRNYKEIGKEFGELADMENLIEKCHKNNIKIIMDLVLNHTSDEHEWFQRALAGDAKYRDYYIFRKGKEGKEPNDWKSFFSGSAWESVGDDEYYLHLFSKKQPDLNWENENMRKELYEIIRWWIEKGIDGFRLDVINFISKDQRFRDGNLIIGNITGFHGIENYLNGPRVHEFLKEIYTYGFKNDEIFTVGECNGLGLETAKNFIERKRNELSTVFSFRHLNMPGKTKWDKYQYDIRYLVEELIEIQGNSEDNRLYSLFTDNHDSPRLISRLKNPKFTEVQGKLINTLLLTLKGIPFIYQGQEIGMTNPEFKGLEDIKDIESLNKAKELRRFGKTEEEVKKIILRGTRDNARVPFIWNEEVYGGMSEFEPWLKCSRAKAGSSVKEQKQDKNSVLNHFKKVMNIRRKYKALRKGAFKVVKLNKKLLIYERNWNNEKIWICMNLTNKKINLNLWNNSKKEIYSNYDIKTESNKRNLDPFECKIFI